MYTETDENGREAQARKDNEAVSPIVGVILMVAVTVILAAVIGVFLLDQGGDTGDAASAGITVDKEPGGVNLLVTDSGNVDGLQVLSPEGAKGSTIPNVVTSGTKVTLRSNSSVFNADDFRIPDTGNGTIEVEGPNDVPDRLKQDLQRNVELEGYTPGSAYLACLIRHSGFEAAGREIGGEVVVPCHSPVLAQSDDVVAGSSEVDESAEVIKTRPLVLQPGDYQLIGSVGDSSNVIQTISVSEDIASQEIGE